MSATGTRSPKLTYDAFQKRKQRREAILPIVVDDDCSAAYELADAQLTRAKSFQDPDGIIEAQKLVADAEKELREATVIFRLRALPREGDGSFAALRAEHPPRDEDHERVRDFMGDPKAKARWHATAFEPALVAASLVEPAVTVEQATAWSREWNDGEWNRLVSAAIDVNQSATDTRGLTFH
jgi:hypothetical protein